MEYVQISMDDYLQLLEDRFEVCDDRGWVGDAARELFPLVLDLISEVGVDPKNSAPSYVVDNFVINGDFISREEFEEHPNLYSSYDDWDEVRDDALVSTDDYACMSF